MLISSLDANFYSLGVVGEVSRIGPDFSKTCIVGVQSKGQLSCLLII
jgi:hypothetical protein